jgi:hypothetical protein
LSAVVVAIDEFLAALGQRVYGRGEPLQKLVANIAVVILVLTELADSVKSAANGVFFHRTAGESDENSQ